jgi:heptosyltransferase-1
LVDHAIRIEPHSHALDRSRELVARALGYEVKGAPRFGLGAARRVRARVAARALETASLHAVSDVQGKVGSQAESAAPSGTQVRARRAVFVHGSSREDKLWPEASWIELGRRMAAAGWRVELPHAGPAELARAERIAHAIDAAAVVWPAMDLGRLVARMGECDGVVGVDSGLSHVAVALDLPHVQIYRHPTAWRTGPLLSHGHLHQVAVESVEADGPSVETVWAAWQHVLSAAR